MALITYTDKETLNQNLNVPDVNKVKADDMNEIKSVVNNNYTEFSNNKPNIATANISGAEQTMTATASYQNVALDNILNQAGTLTWSVVNGTATSVGSFKGVQIPAGVSQIKVSSNILFNNNNNTSAMTFVIYIYRYNASDSSTSMIVRSTTPDVTAGKSASISCVPVIVNVQENDIIFLRAYKSLATSSVSATIGNDNRTWLTIEVVPQ